MKKVFSVVVALIMALGMHASERGKFIHVDATLNKNLKPQIAFAQDHKDGADITTLLVKTVNVNNFNEFTDASRVLIRFADGKAVRLNKAEGSVIGKNKYSKKNGNATISYYETTSEYEVTQDVLDRIQAGTAIIKVRIVFKENDAKDYEIAEGYQEKMTADLLKSYLEAADKNKKAHGDMSDEDF